MAVPSTGAEKTETSPSTSARSSGTSASEFLPPSRLPSSSDQSNFRPIIPKELEVQRQTFPRSEEYRRLFRLPAEEVLIRDYNCALQENFLLQGHMYVFDHYICFYSNLFGFETKKVIPLNEVTTVRRAKAAGIFPTAIEIVAGEKKHFFTSFLSRDDAFKLIKEGWSQYGNGVRDSTDLQGTNLELHSQESGDVEIENASSSSHTVDDANPSERQSIPISEDSKLPVEVEGEIVSSSGVQHLVKDNADSVVNTSSSSSGSNLRWAEENCDAPKVSDSWTKVAESKCPINVEEFFSIFYSDDAVGFLELFHQSCGDKDFKCSSWKPHEKNGKTRDVSFQHPIKIYLGAKYGTCQEIQKYRVYKNSHLVIETLQIVRDVPYGDYFHVEGLWDVVGDGDDSRRSCIVRIYVSVVFSKKTMFKGKIVQSTIDEAQDAYSIWIKNAHELLKQKKLEYEEGAEVGTISSDLNGPMCDHTQVRSDGYLERSELSSDIRLPHDHDPSFGRFNNTTLLGSFRNSISRFLASLQSRNKVPLLLVIAFALILILMQLSIIVLLSTPQKVQLVPKPDYSSSSSERNYEMMTWMGKRIQQYNEEMLVIESLIEKMRLEHKLLKKHLEDLERFRRLQMD